MRQMTFLDLCSGIGGFRLGLERAGHKCIGYCEYDKFARLPMKPCMTRKESGKRMTSQNLRAKMSPMRKSGVSASPARTSPLPGNKGDWSEKEVEYITTLLTSSKAKKKVISPHTYLLKTLRTRYRLTQDSILPPFSLKWTKRGMIVGGRCLIPKISEFRKIESACSLSQILEAEADEKYYLSAEKTQQLLSSL